MVSRKSLRIKSNSVLKKLKKRVGSKPESSVRVQEVNLRQAAANKHIDAAREFIRTRRSSTSENKQKENRTSQILTRKSKNVADQEDSRVKSCTVLAVKLRYPYISRTTSVQLNSRSPNKNSSSSNALPSTTVKSTENDLDEQGVSRKSSRMRKPTSKELRSILISTDDNKLGLEKHNGEVSPKRHGSKSVKPQVSNDTFTPDQKTQVGKVSSGKKVKDDMECVRCGLTPSQFFGRDAEHNTICCICSLVKPPQELKALLQLLKLDCCLNVLNQKNQNALKSNNSPSGNRRMSRRTSKSDDENATFSSNSDVRTLRERNAPRASPSGNRRMSRRTSKSDDENATFSSNSDVRTLRERNAPRAQKGHNQNSPEEQKRSTSQLNRPVRQQKGNATTNLNKPSNTARSPNSPVASSTRASTRLTQKVFSQIKAPTKANKQMLSAVKDIHRNPKRKLSPRTTQNPAKRRKLTETVEVKKNDREHICSSCNSTFAMQWKLKLHELTHTDRSYPNVVLRHAEIENMSHDTSMEGEHSEAMDCVPNNENAVDKESLNEQVPGPAVQQIITPEKLQEDKSISNNENFMESGDDLEHSQAFKQGNEVKPALENNEKIVNKDSKDIQNTQSTEITEAKIYGAPANNKNTEVNQKLDAVYSHDVTTNCNTPSDKDNVEVNEDSDVPTKCDKNPTLSASIDQSTKTKDSSNFGKEPNVSSNFDTNSLSTQEHIKDKVQGERKPSNISSSKSEEPKENENVMEKSKPLDTVSGEDTVLDQSEIQVKEVEVGEESKNNEDSQEPVKAIEETETHELSKTNEGEYAAEDNENNEESEESIEVSEEIEAHELSKTNEDEHAGEENEENSTKVYGDTAVENTRISEDDKVDESSMDENCSKKSVSLKNSSDHCEHEDDERLVIEKENNSENSANECSSVEETETEPKLHHDDQHKADVSENNEKKVNGTVSDDADDEDEDDDDDDGSKTAFESENTSHSEVVVNHAADNTLEHPVDDNMTELYNQMNMMFEGEANEDKTANTETEKKSPDHLGNGDHSCESNDQNK